MGTNRRVHSVKGVYLRREDFVSVELTQWEADAESKRQLCDSLMSLGAELSTEAAAAADAVPTSV